MTHFEFSELNIWAILVASVVNMVIGALWYSRPLFGNAWMKALGFKEEDVNASAGVYIIVFVLGAIIALAMAMFLQGVSGAVHGMLYGGIMALVFVIPTMITHYLMEGRKAGIMLIIAGHELVLFLAYGAILGGWQ